MTKNKLIIIGSSGHAHVIIDLVEKSDNFEILGLIDPFRSRGENELGYKVNDSYSYILEEKIKHNDLYVFIAIGDNWNRLQVYKKIQELDQTIKFPELIHPSAILANDISVGEGTAVMAGAVVNPGVRIEKFCIINTSASIDHDCVIKEFSSIAPGAVLGGSVSIEQQSAVSIGAVIRNAISVGANTVIGAGSLVLEDCPDNSVIYGVPAKVIRKRKEDDNYL